MQSLLILAAWASVAAMFGAGIACVLRRWRLALRLARAITIACPVLLVVMTVAFIVLPMSAHGSDPAGKAAVLSRGVSEVMNCGVLAIAAGFPAAGIWNLARSRVRAD